MTGMVQTDLAHPPAPKYKDEPVEDPHRHPGPQPPHLHHPRPTLLVQPQKQPESPHQPSTTLPSGSYAPHALGNGVIHHQHSYGPPSEQSYYSSHSSYSTASAPSQYSSSGPPEMMAAATQMQRPYPPIYHTPQSSSPASVASQTHEQHNRGIYTQSPQMASQMYGYPPYSPMNPVQPPPYGPNTSPQQHHLTTQPLMVPHPTSTAQLPHHPAQAPTGNLSSSPNSAAAQQPTPPQRTMLNPPHSAASGAPLSASAVHHQNSNVGASSSAAPGPIPATTPLVVRQDSNGVQWIAFEYSRDRVKMEYTIRCDVESVNVDNLSQEFKTENCVYPRACCSKDQYRGNRLVYETECNAVGWALAELNPALRGKRGLIQRAVDSWRNSNQDPRLRSRRVRRMAKINKRQAMPVPPPHMAPSTPVGPGVPSASMPAPGPRPSLGPLPMGPPQLHHHHAQPDGSAGHEEASGATDYTNGTSRPPVSDGLQPGPSPTDIRTAQVFHGYPSYPTPATASGGPRGPSIPPLLRDNGIGSLGRHPTIATSSNRIEEVDDDDDERNPSSDALFGTLPEGKRRKFILVDDNQRGCRVRVKVMLDQVDMDEIPDSYRLSNAVYPRTYFPVQMRDPGRVVPGNRYVKDNTGAEESEDEDEDMPPRRVMVPAPRIDGEGDIAVPRLSRGRRRREVLLNDLGYRMSWSQSRVFAGRMLFLQRSLDAYRNKMRSTMLAAGQDPTTIPRHFETRAGKRRFLERRRRAAGGPTRGVGAHGVSASQRSAEEVEA